MSNDKQEITIQILQLLSQLTESDKVTPKADRTEITDIDNPVEMLTVNQCVEYAKGLSDYTIRKLVEQKKIPFIRAGDGKRGKILIPKPALIEYLKTGS